MTDHERRSQWPCGLRRRSSAARLRRSRVRNPPGAWMFVCCECCVLSGRDLCDGLITRPEESYRLWRVVVCDQETWKTRRLKPATGLSKIQPKWVVTPGKQINKQTKWSWIFLFPFKSNQPVEVWEHGLPKLSGYGPQPLSWAGSRATCVKSAVINMSNRLNHCAVFCSIYISYTQKLQM
jgi:hypothetical protein